MRNTELAGLVLALIGTACWVACFWWMHTISRKQNSMLEELHQVISRIEALSKVEHDLLREVHPVVEKISDAVADVAVAVDAKGTAAR